MEFVYQNVYAIAGLEITAGQWTKSGYYLHVTDHCTC